MSKKRAKNDTNTALKWLPNSFNWICLEFEDKRTSVPIHTVMVKGKTLDALRNFSEKDLTIEIYYDKWYPTTIIAFAGKIFS